MNIAYEAGKDTSIMIDLDEAIWMDAKHQSKSLTDLTYDLWNWLPRWANGSGLGISPCVFWSGKKKRVP